MELRLVEPGTTRKTIEKSELQLGLYVIYQGTWMYMDVIDYQPTKMLEKMRIFSIGTGITDSLVNLDKHGCPSATSNMAEHWNPWKSFKGKGGCNMLYRKSILVTSYNWFVSPAL